MTASTLRALADQHRICGPKYEGCYSHRHDPHCRADGMAWPCDVDAMRSLIDTPYPEDDIKDERARIRAAIEELDWTVDGKVGDPQTSVEVFRAAVLAIVGGEE